MGINDTTTRIEASFWWVRLYAGLLSSNRKIVMLLLQGIRYMNTTKYLEIVFTISRELPDAKLSELSVTSIMCRGTTRSKEDSVLWCVRTYSIINRCSKSVD